VRKECGGAGGLGKVYLGQEKRFSHAILNLAIQKEDGKEEGTCGCGWRFVIRRDGRSFYGFLPTQGSGGLRLSAFTEGCAAVKPHIIFPSLSLGADVAKGQQGCERPETRFVR